MRYLILIVLSIGLLSEVIAQSTLNDGDIAFTRIGMANEQFSFVFLADVASGTVIYLTDEAWNGTGFNTNETTIKFTATSAISAGEECHINPDIEPMGITFTSGNTLATISSVGAFPPFPDKNMLGSAGDNLFAYQIVSGSVSVIAGVHANSGDSNTSGKAWNSESSTAKTLIPTGKTDGANGFVGLFPSGENGEVDNARYKSGSTHSGDKATVLAALMDWNNWEFSNSNGGFTPSATAFNISGGAPSSVEVAATVFLEGAYNGANLNTSLNTGIPTTQPYTNNGHTGGETAGSIPANAVDWVLVELREAASAAAALSSTKVGSAAGFLMNDGSIKATNGTANLTVSLTGNSGSDFYVVIYHRNHLPVMSAHAISESSSVYTIDFTSALGNTYLGATGLASLSGGRFGMLAGDADGDGDVDASDLTTWRAQNGGTFTYNSTNGDFNLDGVINAVDRNDFQQKNESKTSQVPTT